MKKIVLLYFCLILTELLGAQITPNLFVQKFLYHSDSSDFTDIQSKIPGLIKLGLKQNKLVSVVVNSIDEGYNLYNNVTSNSNYYVDITNDSILNYYKEANVQFVIKGNVYEYNKSFYVKAILLDVFNKKTVSINSNGDENYNLLSALASFCKKLDAFLELLIDTKKTKVMLGNYGVKPNSKINDYDILLFKKYLSQDLYSVNNSNFMFINGDVLRDQTGSQSSGNDSLADIVVNGKLLEVGDKLSCAIQLHFKDGKNFMLPIQAKAGNISDLEISVFYKLKSWLNYLATVDSATKKILFNTTESYASYVSKAKKLNDSSYYSKFFLLFQAINKNPNGYEALYLSGMLHFSNKRYEEAISYFEDARKLNSNNDTLLLKLASAYKEAYKFKDSYRIYNILLNKGVNYTPELYKGYGNLCLDIDSAKSAGKYFGLYLATVKTKLDSAIAYSLIGDYFDHINIVDSAIWYYGKSLKLNNKDPITLNSLSTLYLMKGNKALEAKKNDLALSFFKKSKQTFPNKYTYDALKSFYTQTFMFDEVYKLIKKGIGDSIYSKNSVFFNQGVTLYNFSYKTDSVNFKKVIKESIRYFILQDQLINGQPNDNIQNYIGLCYFSIQKYDSAEIYYRKAISIYSYEPIYSLNLAEVQIIQGRGTDALKTLEVVRNNKIVTEKNQVIYYYLKICARVISTPDSSIFSINDKKEFDDFLNSKTKIYSNWSFDVYKSWINDPKNKLTIDIKTKINEYTFKVEDKITKPTPF